MRIAVPHNTTAARAREIVDRKIGQLLAQFGDRADEIDHHWMGDTLRFKGKARGFRVEGTVEITEAAVIIDGKLPLIAKPFESRIRQAVEREAETMFRTA
ncbi:MAG TPA: polyhydroxyalkanoic acid system family protein [Thermoanaerobaculia bacterium]|nr:polyhydroxyalkanoic acid system family protein [Thermoanaerobaculia bacterium]